VAKTYQNLVTEARELLQDTDTDVQRFTDSTLLNILNRGLQDLGRMRPDAFYDLFATNSLNVFEVVESGAVSPQVNWTDVVGIEMMFYPPLVAYLTGVAEITDDEYTTDGRAALLLQQFRGTVLGL
jgi:hypothetical protein